MHKCILHNNFRIKVSPELLNFNGGKIKGFYSTLHMTVELGLSYSLFSFASQCTDNILTYMLRQSGVKHNKHLEAVWMCIIFIFFLSEIEHLGLFFSYKHSELTFKFYV